MVSHGLIRVGDIPTIPAQVCHTEVTTEYRPLLCATVTAIAILEEWVDLDLLLKAGRLYVNESRLNCLCVGLGCAKCDASRAYGILVFVGINANIYDTTKQVLENESQSLGGEHPVESAHKHRLIGVHSGRRALHESRVVYIPRDYLHVFRSVTALVQREVVFAAITEVVDTGAQQRLHLFVRLEDEVQIARLILVLTRPREAHVMSRTQDIHVSKARKC